MEKQNTEFSYELKFQEDKNIKAYNETMTAAFPGFPPIKTTEEQIEELKQELVDSILAAGKEKGWQFGDSVKVTVNLEFELEKDNQF